MTRREVFINVIKNKLFIICILLVNYLSTFLKLLLLFIEICQIYQRIDNVLVHYK